MSSFLSLSRFACFEENQKTKHLKRCNKNNKDEDISPSVNTENLSQKFRLKKQNKNKKDKPESRFIVDHTLANKLI